MTNKEFLENLKNYIEKMEVDLENSCEGVGISLDYLITQGKMPEIYTEVLRRLNNNVYITELVNEIVDRATNDIIVSHPDFPDEE